MEAVGWSLGSGDGARQAASELESVRLALDLDQFEMLTHSYGTAIAEAYIRMHPEHVRRAVLDGPIAMEVPWQQRLRSASDAIAFGIDRLLGSCASKNCGKELRSILGRGGGYEAVRSAILARDPTVGMGAVHFTPTVIDQATLIALRDRSYWSTYLKGLDDALRGDASALWTLGERYYFGVDRFVFYASTCFDLQRPSEFADYVGSDHLSTTYGSELAPCFTYPPADNPFETSVTGTQEPEVLIVASRYDVLTPASLLASAPLLNGAGPTCETSLLGHTNFGDPKVRKLVNSFLRSGGAERAAKRCG